LGISERRKMTSLQGLALITEYSDIPQIDTAISPWLPAFGAFSDPGFDRGDDFGVSRRRDQQVRRLEAAV
jgi:hypothetical protein